jgi:hypothetical protein
VSRLSPHRAESHPTIAARRVAVVLCPEEQRAGWVAMKLRSNHFQVKVANRPEHASEIVAETSSLSLLAVQGPVDHLPCWSAVESIRVAHPELPVLWLCASGGQGEPPAERTRQARGVTFVDRAQLLDRAEALLECRPYPGAIIDAVSRAPVDTLREQFQAEAELLSISLKLTRHTLSSLVSLIPLAGQGYSGRLVLHADRRQLARLRRRLVPTRGRITDAELADLGGELLNQTAGRIKAALRPYGTIQVGLPVVVGAGSLPAARPGGPDLLLDLALFGRHLFLELSLPPIDVAAPLPETAVIDPLGAGELSFL